MKKICFAIVVSLLITIYPAHAVDTISNGDNLDPVASFKNDVWQKIESRIRRDQKAAKERISSTTFSKAGADSWSSDELIEQYTKLERKAESGNGRVIQKELNEIETLLNSQGTVFLTDAEMKALFPDNQIYVVTDGTTRGANNTYPIETSTSINYWSATSTSTQDGYSCAILSAWPKADSSSLRALYKGIDIAEASEYSLTRSIISNLWKKIENTAISASQLGILYDILDIIPSNSTSTAEYTIDVISSVRAKFCWIYKASLDMYVVCSVAHTNQEAVYHDYYYVDIRKTEETLKTRSTTYFSDSALKQKAVARFIQNGGSSPFVDRFSLSGVRCVYKNTNNQNVTKQFTYVPPYAVYHGDVY